MSTTAYARRGMLSGMSAIDSILSALAHPVRRAALRLLAARGELCLCELMAELGVAQSVMSRHMAALREAGLASDRRDGQWVRFRTATGPDPALHDLVSRVLSWPEAGMGRPAAVQEVRA